MARVGGAWVGGVNLFEGVQMRCRGEYVAVDVDGVRFVGVVVDEFSSVGPNTGELQVVYEGVRGVGGDDRCW